MKKPKTRPIIFSGPMVRAILDGRKTQTRRIIKPQPPEECSIHYMLGNESWLAPDKRSPLRHCWEAWGGDLYKNRPERHLCGLHFVKCPYGAPGDRLWVRETFLAVGGLNPDRARIVYRATNDGPDQWISPVWKPSIHMPRWASRITLEITDVRVERVKDISCADAIAEGIRPSANSMTIDCETADPRQEFARVWDSINGKRSLDANPYVWALTFKVVD